MPEKLSIESHKGAYEVAFCESSLRRLDQSVRTEGCSDRHFIIDERVAGLYRDSLQAVLDSKRVLLIEANEGNKALDKFTTYIEHLAAHGVRRNHLLVAIGGGIIQDITCFLAAVLMRGMRWKYYPTTLLAQADSCIGSKSSINVGKIKNFVGTFTPPSEVEIDTAVLKTLSRQEILSGIGEMLKVHAIAGPAEFDLIAADYPALLCDDEVLRRYIYRSLAFKKRLIELDEFDEGPRKVMNYGHTFGHAIESATDFGIPHGIAITVGMDMANFVAANIEVTSQAHFKRMHPALFANYEDFRRVPIELNKFLEAIAADKKNVGADLTLILPDGSGQIGISRQPNDQRFRSLCKEFLKLLMENGK